MTTGEQPRRIALLISPTLGEKWVTTIPDTGHVPKFLHKRGEPFTVLMTMSTAHTAFAKQWEASR